MISSVSLLVLLFLLAPAAAPLGIVGRGFPAATPGGFVGPDSKGGAPLGFVGHDFTAAAALRFFARQFAAAAQTAPTPEGPIPQSFLDGFTFRSMGPYRGGRVTTVSGVPSEPLTFYFGSSGGGVWKTTNGGVSWENISDGYFAAGSIGAVAVAESDPNVIYVGTGSAAPRGNVSPGVGAYKSEDGGATWRHIGLERAGQIDRIRIHPEDPDIVYFAILGQIFGPDNQRGVYRSEDGGERWDRVLFTSERTGVVDLAMDPSDPDVLFAATWTAERKPWNLIGGPNEGGIFRTRDGSETWIRLSAGLPTGVIGKLAIAISPANPERVWAVVEHEPDGGLYRSDDRGANWTHVSDDRRLRARAWYYTNLYAHPTEEDTIYYLGEDMWVSRDGGETLEQIAVPHVDHHDLWINPTDPDIMVEGNDGGATVTFDGGGTWSTQMNQPTAEMYRVTVDDGFPYRVYGAQQDNTTISIPSRTAAGGITIQHWRTAGGGESGHIAVDPRTTDVVYAGSHGGQITRLDLSTGALRRIMVYPQTHLGMAAADMRYRFQWNSPIRISPHDPTVLYQASQHLHRSLDEGLTWEEISPDLTRNEKAKQVAAGGPVSRDATSVETYNTIFAFEESPHAEGELWAGTDDGLVWIRRGSPDSTVTAGTEDDAESAGESLDDQSPDTQTPDAQTAGEQTSDAQTPDDQSDIAQTPPEQASDDQSDTIPAPPEWLDITPADMPGEGSTVNMIELSRIQPGRAYLAVHRYRMNDFSPYIYRTDDFGESWRRLTDGSNGIPPDHFVRVVREDPHRAGLLYAGTEFGLYVSLDDGGSWQRFQQNLPITPVTDLALKDQDLVVATQGRGFWLLDDLTPLHQLAEEVATRAFHLYQPKGPFRVGGTRAEEGMIQDPLAGGWTAPHSAGKNPSPGMVISYWLALDTEDEVVLEILDSAGARLRKFTSRPLGTDAWESAPPLDVPTRWVEDPDRELPAEAGLNRVSWDLAYAPLNMVENAFVFGFSADGPTAVPGTFQVRLTIGDWSATRPFQLRPDPRLSISLEEYRARFDLLMEIQSSLADIQTAVRRIRAELDQRSQGDIAEGLEAVLEELMQTRNRSRMDPLNFPPKLMGQLGFLYAQVRGSDGEPTAAARQRFEELVEALAAPMARLQELMARTVTSK